MHQQTGSDIVQRPEGPWTKWTKFHVKNYVGEVSSPNKKAG